MKWFETIDLRSIEDGSNAIKQAVKAPLMESDRKEGLKGLSLHRNAFVKTDIRIQLQWETEGRFPEKSDLGLRLASALQDFGRINHTLWIKEEGEE